MFSCAPSKNRDRRGKAAQKVLQRLHETHLPDWALNESPKSTGHGMGGWKHHDPPVIGKWSIVNGQWQVRSWSMVNGHGKSGQWSTAIVNGQWSMPIGQRLDQ